MRRERCSTPPAAGVAFERIAVLWPGQRPYARLVEHHLTAAGIPWNGRPGTAVAERLAPRLVLDLLDIDRRGLRRHGFFSLVADVPPADPDGGFWPTAAWERDQPPGRRRARRRLERPSRSAGRHRTVGRIGELAALVRHRAPLVARPSEPAPRRGANGRSGASTSSTAGSVGPASNASRRSSTGRGKPSPPRSTGSATSIRSASRSPATASAPRSRANSMPRPVASAVSATASPSVRSPERSASTSTSPSCSARRRGRSHLDRRAIRCCPTPIGRRPGLARSDAVALRMHRALLALDDTATDHVHRPPRRPALDGAPRTVALARPLRLAHRRRHRAVAHRRPGRHRVPDHRLRAPPAQSVHPRPRRRRPRSAPTTCRPTRCSGVR